MSGSGGRGYVRQWWEGVCEAVVGGGMGGSGGRGDVGQWVGASVAASGDAAGSALRNTFAQRLLDGL